MPHLDMPHEGSAPSSSVALPSAGAASPAAADSTIDVGIHLGAVPVVALPWPDDCGGECVFIGRTRGETHAQFGRLLRLEYEMYEPMAVKVMHAMALDAAERLGCRAVRIVHAKGPVALGEASVVIQVATAHRGESFVACKHLIDRIKHELPVWKREIWERGSTFVEGSVAHSA